ncbi:MAG: hypothetical protein ACRDLM_03735 [Gaiellaceae bacterium]
MTTQISPQMRIVALAGVLLIALAGGALMFLRHSAPTAGSPPATHPATKPSSPASHRHASTPPRRVKIVNPAINPLLPGPLRGALARHPLVVVATYDPQVRVDSLVVSEARAGANGANAGFLQVNLLDDSVAGRLTALLPANQLLPTPGILVYNRHGKVVYRFDGYLDRAAITQAVDNLR